MKKNIETNLLRTFVTISETRSFTRSAQILFRSQSAITIQMQKLESILGCKLFYQSGRSLIITDEGEKLLKYALEILRLNDEIQSNLMPTNKNAEIRIGTSDDYAVMLLPQILEGFIKKNPHVTLTTNCSNRDQNIEMLKKGDLDIILAPAMLDEKIGEALRVERLVWIGGQEMEISEEEAVPLTGFPIGCVCRDIMIRSLNQAGRTWKFVYSSNSIVSIHSTIRSSRVVSAVEESTVPTGTRILDGRFNLPPLPKVKIAILQNKGTENQDIINLYEHLKNNISNAPSIPADRVPLGGVAELKTAQQR